MQRSIKDLRRPASRASQNQISQEAPSKYFKSHTSKQKSRVKGMKKIDPKILENLEKYGDKCKSWAQFYRSCAKPQEQTKSQLKKSKEQSSSSTFIVKNKINETLSTFIEPTILVKMKKRQKVEIFNSLKQNFVSYLTYKSIENKLKKSDKYYEKDQESQYQQQDQRKMIVQKQSGNKSGKQPYYQQKQQSNQKVLRANIQGVSGTSGANYGSSGANYGTSVANYVSSGANYGTSGSSGAKYGTSGSSGANYGTSGTTSYETSGLKASKTNGPSGAGIKSSGIKEMVR